MIYLQFSWDYKPTNITWAIGGHHLAGPLARGAWADVEPHWSRLGWRTRDQRCGVAASGDLGGGGLWDLPSLDAEPAAGDLANSTNWLWDLMGFNGIEVQWKIFDR
jgi:hypothetical protein